MNIRTLKSKDYNWIFNTSNGTFLRWGNKLEVDPQYSPVGPEILDIEVSTSCLQSCSHCYKSNNPSGENMSFCTFKTILDKMPNNLTQVAFGIGDVDANRELFVMFAYCRLKGIVPNVTINGARLTPRIVNKLSRYCGAVAVSNYDKDVCYDAVSRLTGVGMKQVNIHQLLSKETLSRCYEVIDDYSNDKRLSKLRAIVFLTLKPKGARNTYSPVTPDEYNKLVDTMIKNKINFGFDSCGAGNFKSYVGTGVYDHFIEPCESCLFSSYINVEGKFFPCSFTEGEDGYEGISVLEKEDYLKDVWFADSTVEFRKKLLENSRNCPIFKVSF